MKIKNELLSTLRLNLGILEHIADGDMLLYTVQRNANGHVIETNLVPSNHFILELIMRDTKQMIEEIEKVDK